MGRDSKPSWITNKHADSQQWLSAISRNKETFSMVHILADSDVAAIATNVLGTKDAVVAAGRDLGERK